MLEELKTKVKLLEARIHELEGKVNVLTVKVRFK
jgi:hypothetical protein